MDEQTLTTFEESLARCSGNPGFFDRFYGLFMASSPKVAEKFANTDFGRQKRALEESLHTMLLAARDEPSQAGPYLRDLAERHSSRDLNIGAELYDYWLDSLLETVQEFDPQFDPSVYQAWEKVMMQGIAYLLSRY
ncbi:MAG: globin [Bryobacteraceae bacterium]